MLTILEILNLSTDYLQKKGVQHARRQAEEMLGEALKIGRMGLYLEYDRPLVDKELELCRLWLKRRGQGEPLQYISGKVDFLDCEILVSPKVLIPRQETEILADKIATEIATVALSAPLEGKVLWDVCCGSGCLGIALKKRFPQLRVVLADISTEALSQAKLNAEHNQVEVDFVQGDLLEPLDGSRCDFFVCNPPYIAAHEMADLEIEVRGYEPLKALVSGPTGLEFYIRLAKDLPSVLNSGAKVWLEIGKDQGKALLNTFHAPHWKCCRVDCDWSGHERFFSLEIE